MYEDIQTLLSEIVAGPLVYSVSSSIRWSGKSVFGMHGAMNWLQPVYRLKYLFGMIIMIAT